MVEAPPLAAPHDETVAARAPRMDVRLSRVVLWLATAVAGAIVMLALSGHPAAAATTSAATSATTSAPSSAPTTPAPAAASTPAHTVQTAAATLHQRDDKATATLKGHVATALSSTLGALSALDATVQPRAQAWWHDVTSTSPLAPPRPGDATAPAPPDAGTTAAGGVQIARSAAAPGPMPAHGMHGPVSPPSSDGLAPGPPPSGGSSPPSPSGGDRATTSSATTVQACVSSSVMPRPERSSAPGPDASGPLDDPGRTIPSFPD